MLAEIIPLNFYIYFFGKRRAKAQDKSTGTTPITALKGTHRDLSSKLPDSSLFHLRTKHFVILEDVILPKPPL